MRTTVTIEGHTTWHLSRAELVCLLTFMSTDSSRQSQYGCLLDTARGRAEATDGHRGVVCRTGDRLERDRGIAGSYLVPRDLLERVRKLAKQNDEIRITVEGEAVVLSVGELGAFTGKVSSATFPPLDRIFPDHNPKHRGAVAAFNGDYLADMKTITDACPPLVIKEPRGKLKKMYPGLVIYPPDGELDPMLVKTSCPANSCDWTAVLMPMRI